MHNHRGCVSYSERRWGVCGLKTVAKAAKNRGKAGKHPISGVGLYWMYYDEWLELQNNN